MHETHQCEMRYVAIDYIKSPENPFGLPASGEDFCLGSQNFFEATDDFSHESSISVIKPGLDGFQCRAAQNPGRFLKMDERQFRRPFVQSLSGDHRSRRDDAP